jgi:hypothetical protein
MSVHADWCEGEPTHVGGCTAATKMARLQAFAEIVRDEFNCTTADVEESALPDGHEDDCWHHAALLALAEPGR